MLEVTRSLSPGTIDKKKVSETRVFACKTKLQLFNRLQLVGTKNKNFEKKLFVDEIHFCAQTL